MKKRLTVVAGLALVGLVFAEQPPAVEWTRTLRGMGWARGRCVISTSDAGFVAAGQTSHPDSSSSWFYIAKLDANGDSVWASVFWEPDAYSNANWVSKCGDGGYIVVGEVSRRGRGVGDSLMLLKFTSAGALEWDRRFQCGTSRFAWGLSVEQTADSGFAIGAVGSPWTGWVIKTDPSGLVEWDTAFADDYGVDRPDHLPLITTREGGFLLCIRQDTENFSMIKMDASGSTTWSRTHPGQGLADAFAVVQTPDGGFAATGRTRPLSGPESRDMFLMRTDSAGNLRWKRTYGGGKYDDGLALARTSDGGYITGGRTVSSGLGNYDAYVVRTDSGGNLRWSTTLGSIGHDEAVSVAQTPDGGFMVGGLIGTSEWGMVVWKLRPETGGR